MGTIRARDSAYRIGAVSRLTGVTQDALRVWERRYGVVEPQRSEGGDRLYSREDVTRLTLIKRLVDAGHAISRVARLTLKQLQQRLAPQDLAALTLHETCDVGRIERQIARQPGKDTRGRFITPAGAFNQPAAGLYRPIGRGGFPLADRFA